MIKKYLHSFIPITPIAVVLVSTLASCTGGKAVTSSSSLTATSSSATTSQVAASSYPINSSAPISSAEISSSTAQSSVAAITPFTIPRRIQSEDFFRAQDNTPNNSGNCGTGSVDQYSVPTGFLGTCDIGDVENGEWLEYAINIPNAGQYDFTVSTTSEQADTDIILSIANVEIGRVQTKGDGLTNYSKSTLENITLDSGIKTLRVSFTSNAALTFNFVEITAKIDDATASSSSSVSSASSSVEAIGNIAQGQELYSAKCGGCHDDPDSPIPGTGILGGFPGSNIVDEDGRFQCELTDCGNAQVLADYLVTDMPFGSVDSCEGSCANDIAVYIAETFQRDVNAVEKVAFVTRFPRLTHTQWKNSLKDLFSLTNAEVNAVALSPDSPEGHYQNNQRRTFVRQELLADYDTAVKTIAATLTQDIAKIESYAGTLPVNNKAQFIINAITPKVYRRPITGTERSELINLYNQGTDAYSTIDNAVIAGTRLLLTGLLQSPHFLYRVENSRDLDAAAGLIPLNDYEIATRLSYTILNSTPDTGLLEAAADGVLGTQSGLDDQINRLLESPKGKTMVRDFHNQTLDTNRLNNLMRDPALYPDFTTQDGKDMATALRRFTQAIIHDDTGSLRDLFMTPSAYVNDALAPIYGLAPTGSDELTRVTLSSTERAGLLTQAGFLAANANERESDPIHRGVFIQERLICRPLGSPPNNVPPVPDVETQTQRERLDLHTETCGGVCHDGLINNAGYAFEGYGALGEHRTSDSNGFTIDAMSSLVLDGVDKTYNGAVEFSQVLSETEETHDCYTGQWIEYALGRDITPSDKLLKDNLVKLSYQDNLPILELIKATLLSDAFRYRANDAAGQ